MQNALALFENLVRPRTALEIVRGTLIAMPEPCLGHAEVDPLEAAALVERAAGVLAPYREALERQFDPDASVVLEEVRVLTAALREAVAEHASAFDGWGAPTADLRARALARLVRSYDQLRRMVSYLRWEQGDADLLAPPLVTPARAVERLAGP